MHRFVRFCFALFAAFALPIPTSLAAQPPQDIRIAYLYGIQKGRLTISLLDRPPVDRGLDGAKVAINDNNTTGRFMGQNFILTDIGLAEGADPVPEVQKLLAGGVQFIVADVSAPDLLKIADAVKEKDVLVFNAGSPEDSLREQDCRDNVIHTAPTYSMLADGLAQYLVWKQWRDWFLVVGSHPEDKLFGDALKRSAERFGAKIVFEKEFTDTGVGRQADSGITQVQRLVPVFTQDAPDYQVLVAADRSEVFGTYLPYRTWLPRPVAGSAGLMPVSWHGSFENWGANQMQSRFVKASHRPMSGADMNAWTAVRMIGEAATRTKSANEKDLAAFIKAPDFSVAAFRGQKLTLRNWNWQLREPILLSDARSVVSVSPQEGFLHQVSVLDTLGVDQPETTCKLK
jgi:ABC transporter substrate binding protein (PQQ-dependent alcohol dehydrogenase system)